MVEEHIELKNKFLGMVEEYFKLGNEFLEEVAKIATSFSPEKDKDSKKFKEVVEKLTSYLKETSAKNPKKVAVGIGFLLDFYANPVFITSVLFELMPFEEFVERFETNLKKKVEKNIDEYFRKLAFEILLAPIIQERLTEFL